MRSIRYLLLALTLPLALSAQRARPDILVQIYVKGLRTDLLDSYRAGWGSNGLNWVMKQGTVDVYKRQIQSSINEFIKELFGGCENFFNVDVEPFVPQRLKEKYEKSAAIRMFSFTSPLPLSESLRKKVTEAAQEFEVEVRIRDVYKRQLLM